MLTIIFGVKIVIYLTRITVRMNRKERE